MWPAWTFCDQIAARWSWKSTPRPGSRGSKKQRASMSPGRSSNSSSPTYIPGSLSVASRGSGMVGNNTRVTELATHFKIGGAVIAPGESRTVEIPVAPTYAHDDLAISVHVVHGKRAGPALFVCA